MNEMTKQIQQIMYPKAALIAYECETADFSRPQNYLELRPINERGRMGAGIPVTYEFMNSLTESYTEGMNGTPHGRIPPNMLLCDPRKGHEKYIWYNPPQKRKMYFQSCLHITDGTFNVTGADVCLGNSALEKPLDTDFSGFQEYWEKRFWLSEFSHLGGSRNPTRSNLVSVTEKARENPFDYSDLKPSGKKLKDILL